MVKFILNKIGRDKGLEGFKSQEITPIYKYLKGDELCAALANKLIEESHEVREAHDSQEVIHELADLLEVIDGLCKAYKISYTEIIAEKEKRYNSRGGFEKGLFIESINMSADNQRVEHF